MRVALIGIDDLSRQLVQALAASNEHSLVAAYLANDEPAQPANSILNINQSESWESLLARREIDAVIVAPSRDVSLREEQLKRLVQGSVPVAVVHPACDVMFAYELEMMRREVSGVIIPVAADWWHPGWDRLADWMNTQGTIEQISFQRSLADRGREHVLRQFVRDVWLIRRLIGPIKNVSAAGATDEDASLTNLNVHCLGENEMHASWSVVSPAMEAQSKFSIILPNEIATLHMPSGDAEWVFEVRGATSIQEHFPIWQPGDSILKRVERVLNGEPAVPSWSDICLDLEAAESVEKSLRRKRAVDLHTGEASEDQTFKGFMAAGGCLILIVILLAFICLAVVEGFRVPLQDVTATSGNANSDENRWPLLLRLWPVYPLVGFLLLQFLLLLAKRPPAKPKST